MTVAVELTRSCDAPDVARALQALGLETQLGSGNGNLLVRADDLAQVEHALDSWMLERGLPFIPIQIDEQTVVVAPPPA
jgi:hypothetical protein